MVRVEVSPSEWRYVYPLKVIAGYMRSRKPGASRHDVTKWLSIIEDYTVGMYGKTATVSRVLQDFERRFGFESEEEREMVAEAAKVVVDEVARVMNKYPENVSVFIKNLRNVVLGVFYGIIDPVPYEPKSKSNSGGVES
jgi:hypothetical protein